MGFCFLTFFPFPFHVLPTVSSGQCDVDYRDARNLEELRAMGEFVDIRSYTLINSKA